MDSSEQRRKRKRLLRPPSTASSYFLTVRTFLLCFSFLLFLYLLSYKIPVINSSAFRPVLVVSSFSLMSSSSSGVESLRGFGRFLLPVKIEGRVLFPDHVLLLVRKNGLSISTELECVYYNSDSEIETGNLVNREEIRFVKMNVLSVDDYDQSRVIVKCPIPPRNHSIVVNLQRMGRNRLIDLRARKGIWKSNQSVASWDNVVYTATLDQDSAVVFVKGLNLRPDREANPRKFTCHFGLGSREKDGRFALGTRAITAAQEVVRCSLPLSIRKTPEKALGVRVTIGINGRAQERVLLPSVAKISSLKLKSNGKEDSIGNEESIGKKYELCVCTMVWNQAFALREWIMYHTWLGVERWFIYDNNSNDGIKDVIDELEMENFNVTRHIWPWIKTQEAGFSHCALRAKSECNWVSFMDVDEFFYFPYSTPHHQRFRSLGYAGENSLRDLVANFSSSSRSLAEIRTACHSYGPSGLNSPPPQGVTVGYTCRLKSPERHKSIIRPDALDPTLLNVVHHFHLKKGFRYINLPQGTAVINHYKYQVWEVFRAKFFRRVATYVADWQENQNEGSRDRAPGLGTEAIEPQNWRLQFCEVWDTGLRDFVLANFADFSTGFLPWERSNNL